MNILIITQKVDKNDPVLGFFHRWLEEFAGECHRVFVLCLEKGQHTLPENVQILSLGKEQGKAKATYIFRLYKYIFQYRKDYDVVFVHMNPEYVVLGGWFWKLWNKTVALWYVHRQVNLKLKIAEKFVKYIFTVTKGSFKLRSNKIIAVGHGIDTEYFSPTPHPRGEKQFTLLSVGRITRIKKLEDLVEAVGHISSNIREQIRVRLVGAPVTPDDEMYKKELEMLVQEKKLSSVVSFVGNIPFSAIRDKYRESNLCVNAAPTGGIDKAVLEAFSCGVPTLFRNEAFLGVLGNWGEQLWFRDIEELAQKISLFVERQVNVNPQELHEMVAKEHDVKGVIKRMMNFLASPPIRLR